jgi:hypothetical protein
MIENKGSDHVLIDNKSQNKFPHFIALPPLQVARRGNHHDASAEPISNRHSQELESVVNYRKQRTDDFLIAKFGAIFHPRPFRYLAPSSPSACRPVCPPLCLPPSCAVSARAQLNISPRVPSVGGSPRGNSELTHGSQRLRTTLPHPTVYDMYRNGFSWSVR